jgi:hypothetical protein
MRYTLRLFGLSLLLAPTLASAALSDAAVSPYVKETLLRAEKGIASSRKNSSMSFFSDAMPSWLRAITSAVVAGVDTQSRIVQEQKGLLQNTACLRIDLYLLEQEMEKVRLELGKALDERDVTAILRLQELLLFLNTRYDILLKGAKDPALQDSTWSKKYQFDETPVTSPPPPLCPFTSDYLPASPEGYGCDAETIQNSMSALPPGSLKDALGKETDALIVIEAAVKDYYADVAALASLQKNIGTFVSGGSSSSSAPASPRLHGVIRGCQASGLCEDTQLTCNDDSDCGDSDCIVPKEVGSCSWNPSMKCSSDLACPEGNGQCLFASDLLRTELRGPFSLEKDQGRLLQEFITQRRDDGARRSIPVYLRKEENFLFQLLARNVANNYQAFSIDQGSREGLTFATGADPLLSARDAFSRLRTSVAELGKLGSDKNGLRGFVRDFASYLRRTCMDRPCNNRLESILKVVFTDVCFPYSSGDYLKDTCENPRWRQCMMEAFGSAPAADECAK